MVKLLETREEYEKLEQSFRRVSKRRHTYSPWTTMSLATEGEYNALHAYLEVTESA